MNSTFAILKSVEENNSKLSKQQILTTHRNNVEFAELLNAALNYQRRFHMKKWTQQPPATEPTASHIEFMTLLSLLESRTITGHAAIVATESFFSKCSADQIKWYTRVLQQDLKVGISIETAIKCGFEIPKFEVQLATDGHKCKRLQDILTSGCKASRKLDGYRCIAIIDRGEVSLYSRNGTEYENFPTIKKVLQDSYPTAQLVLDGEILSTNFNAMQQTAFASKRGTAVGDVTFNVFDYIPLEEWTSDKFTTPHVVRIQLLQTALNTITNKELVRVVEHIDVKSLNEVLELEQIFINQGFEGVMINPNIPYYRGRKANCMLKFKTMLSMECRIIDFYEGEVGTKHQGSLGGVVVEQENGRICRVGSGFSDEEREWIWNNKNLVQNDIIEVKYQELTPDLIMRFPVKFRYRNFCKDSLK